MTRKAADAFDPSEFTPPASGGSYTLNPKTGELKEAEAPTEQPASGAPVTPAEEQPE